MNLKGLRNTRKSTTTPRARCIKKAKENWIGEQCSETEETLRKNNSKRAYQLVKELINVNKGKLLLSKIVKENASQKNDRY